MKSETSMGCFGRQLASTLLLGLLAQLALATMCRAADEAGAVQWTTAMPEDGAPPAPIVAAEAEDIQPALPGEVAAASENDGRPPKEAEAPNNAETAEPALAEGTTDAALVEDEARELSVSPAIKPLLPEGHPSWVGAPPDLSNPRRHRLFVGSFPTLSLDEVDAALDEPMLAAVNGYIDEHVLEGRGAAEIHLTSDFVRHNLLDRSAEYVAELNTSSGPLYQKWVVLEITPEHRKYFAAEYRQVEQKKRMVALGLGLFGLLSLMGIAHFAFNRRQRRYAPTAQPVVHAWMAEPEPVAGKHGGRILWVIGGCLACLAIPLLMIALFLVVGETHRVSTATIDISPQVSIRGEPPMPPMPPQPPQIYIEPSGSQDGLTPPH